MKVEMLLKCQINAILLLKPQSAQSVQSILGNVIISFLKKIDACIRHKKIFNE